MSQEQFQKKQQRRNQLQTLKMRELKDLATQIGLVYHTCQDKQSLITLILDVEFKPDR